MFQFSRQERYGIIAMGIILLLLIAVNSFLHLLFPPKPLDVTVADLKAVPQFEKATPYSGGQKEYNASKYVAEEKPAKQQQPVVDLNTADSLALVSLNGIGPVFASRIIKFRSLLGGFYKKEQLKEVYGFDEEKYNLVAPYVAVKAPVIKINLNACTFKELNKHPYIEYDLTKAIFGLKKKIGKFQSVEEIKQVDLVTEELYNKIAPYLSTQ